MSFGKLPLQTWIVIDRTMDAGHIVSTHAVQDEAEGERDKRNEGLTDVRYGACMIIEPVAQGMCRPWR